MLKSRARCRITDQRPGCHLPCCSVASVRKRLQTSGIKGGRSSEGRGCIRGAVLARHTFLEIYTPLSALFQATLQTIPTPFFVIQFHAFRSQILWVLWGGEEGKEVSVSVSRCPLSCPWCWLSCSSATSSGPTSPSSACTKSPTI